MHCYFNGKITLLEKAAIHLYDVGLLRGFGVFEVIRTYKGKPFEIASHIDRLGQSAKILNLTLPIDKKEIIKTVEKLLAINKFSHNREAVIRIVLTGGKSEDGFSYNPASPTFFILTEPFHKLPLKYYTNGIKLITREYQREFAIAKTLNYMSALCLQNQKARENAFEVLYVSNKRILEASTSNFFMVKDRKIITPKDEILLGITRNVIIKLAKNHKFKVQERKIHSNEIKSVDEVFITATNKDIVPVVKIDKLTIGNGKVGKNTKYLMNLFHEFTSSI